MSVRITQVTIETLETGGNPNALTTQCTFEVLTSGPGNPNARISQCTMEVLTTIRAQQPLIQPIMM